MERVSKILDWRGEPIRTKQLAEEQTSRLGSLQSEYATHPSRGLTPGRLASILASAEQGDLVDQCDLYEDMEEKDAHIFAEMSKRKRALLGLDWQLEPPRNATPAEEKAVAMATEWLQDMDDFEDMLFDIADAIGVGYSNCELEWRNEQGVLLPLATHRPARWFTVDREDRNRLLLRTQSGQGEALWPAGWISHVHKAKSGYIGRAGLHRVLAWPFLFKNYSVRDLAEFLEIYGLPVRLGTYPAGASDQEKSTLLRAVVNIGHNAAGIIPEGMEIDFKDAAKGGSDPFQAMIAWCEGSQSKAILGGTLTSSAESTGLGSNLGDVHNEVRHDLMVSDARQISGTLTRDLVWPMIALNISGIDPRRAPRFKFITDDDEDLQARAERDKTLFECGFRLTDDKVAEIYGDGYERIEQDKPPTGTAAAKASTALSGAVAAARDTADDLADNLEAASADAVRALLAPIRRLVMTANSMEGLRDRLFELYQDLPSDQLAGLMAEAMAAAELAGMAEVEDGQ
jgi:phage gp29-like protein